MKLLWQLMLASALLFPPASAQTSLKATPGAAQVSVDAIDLMEVRTDHISLKVSAHVLSGQKIRIHRISFGGMRLGRVPMYMGPVEGPLELKGEQILHLPPIPLTLYFRDLDSLVPLTAAIQEGQVTIEGQARIELDLNFIQKLGLRQWSARTELPIREIIPVVAPGGALGRVAALTALKAADAALHLGESTLGSLRRSQAEWTEVLGKDFVPALILAESRYSFMTNDGQRVDMVQDGVGFRIPHQRFVLTAEMLAPWKFNAEVSAMLKEQRATLMTESVELLAWPANEPIEPATGRSLRQGTLKVLEVENGTESVEMPGAKGYGRVQVSKRDTARNLATLEFRTSEAIGPALPMAGVELLQANFNDRVAVFRFDGKDKPEVVFSQAHREGDRLVLDTPVDESAFGSPVMTKSGAVAMLQDEHSGVLLKHLF